ncbi:MAG: hypothetical protein J6S67_03955 [Methanobrevibacter sp.]|nr:hypothetical protein [Methanobrevibacter sp.]
MDWNKIKEGLKALITDSTSTEDVEKVTSVVKDIEVAEAESNDMLQKHEELRKKYIEAVKNSTFTEKPKEDNPQPKTLEECIQEQLANRKD